MEKLFNKTVGSIAEILIITYELGILTGLQVVLGELTPDLISEIGISDNKDVSRVLSMVLFNLIFMLPLSLYKNLGSLITVSLLGFGGLCYVGACIMIEFPFFIADHGFEGITFANVDTTIFPTITICLMNYFCHTNLAKIQGELQGSSVRRMKKITVRTILMLISTYSVLGLFGYLSTLEATPEIIVNRAPPGTISNDWAMIVGRFFICVTLVSAVPINLNPCRAAIIHMFFHGDTSDKVHIGLTTALMEVSLLVAIFIPNVIAFYSILGAICSGTICLVFPSKC
mmetsp:Transcript_34116/g.59523  ORF Transcript_34116/g.59523 Transcript_34116/m.59523 type:complete len:286 (-) Transcript_34116:45-902(-)